MNNHLDNLAKKERILLVSVYLKHKASELYISPLEFEAAVEETEELIKATNGVLIQSMTCSRNNVHPAHFVGKGKLEEIREIIDIDQIDLVVFNHQLSASQERNLESELCCRVIDRVGLILDIFANRAQTQEGRLQVELAQLNHLKSRLVRGYGSLQSQRGGIGLKGPGETKLETDRRLISDKIHQLESKIKVIKKQRTLQRKKRMNSQQTIFAIVGYTNAGKSSLINLLTNSSVFAEDLLFATLDTTTRKLWLQENVEVILIDTVGFIRNLPHELIAAFSATLEEAKYADFLLHVVDFSDRNYLNQIDNVNQVLNTIGADAISQIILYNKIDKLGNERPQKL